MTYWLSHVKKTTKLARRCLRKVRITYTILCILFPSENLGSQLTYMSILGAIIFSTELLLNGIVIQKLEYERWTNITFLKPSKQTFSPLIFLRRLTFLLGDVCTGTTSSRTESNRPARRGGWKTQSKTGLYLYPSVPVAKEKMGGADDFFQLNYAPASPASSSQDQCKCML